MKKLYHCLLTLNDPEYTYGHITEAVIIAESEKEVIDILEFEAEEPDEFEIHLIDQDYIDNYDLEILCEVKNE